MAEGNIFETLVYKDGYTRVIFNPNDLVINPGHSQIDGTLTVNSNIDANQLDTVSNFHRITVVDSSIVANLNSNYLGSLGYAEHTKGVNTLDTAMQEINVLSGQLGDVAVPAWMINDELNSLQSEIDATQSGSGLEGDGSYVANQASTYLKTAVSLYTADQILDAELSNLATVVSNLGSAFNYVGTLVAGVDEVNPVELYDITDAEQGRNKGDYYKITDGGWFTLNGGDPFYVNPNDGIVFNNVGTVDIIDNTNSNIRSGDAYVNVVGNEDTGFDVSLDTVFVFRIDTLEQEVDSLQLGLQANDLDNVSLHTELDATQVGAGLNEDGSYSPDLTAKYIDTATSLKDADIILDTKLKDNAVQMESQEYLQTITLVASEALSIGDLVSLSGSGFVAKSSMSHPTLSKVIGVAKSNVQANESVKIAIQGQLVSGIKVSDNSPALSYGDTVFLEELGSVSKTPPQINGINHVVEVGVLVDEVGPVFLFLSRRIAI